MDTRDELLFKQISADQQAMLNYCTRNVAALPYAEANTLAGKVFCVTTNDITSGANTNEGTFAKFLFHNNSTTKRAKIYKITTGTNVSTNNNIFRLYRDPVITSVASAALLTPANLLIGDNSPVSEMKCYTDTITVSSNGQRMLNICQGPTGTDTWIFNNIIVVEPGKKLLVTVRPNTTSVTYSLNVLWVEE